jgi:hypothetical protein
MKRAYCEEYIDRLTHRELSLPQPAAKPSKRDGPIGDYDPEKDPLMAFEESGVNSPETLADVDRVFYNRVAKCGSRTVMRILEKLEKLNNFTIYKSKVYDKMKMQLEEQVR